MVLVDVVISAMVKVDIFCKWELFTVSFELFDGKNARLVVSKLGR